MFDSLPVELIADILGELDLASLIVVSCLSRRLRAISSDPSLNPWRAPILRNLRLPADQPYEPEFKHLAVRMTVPRHNWLEILSMARASWILFEATIPNLKDSEWEECFNRRFLPGWRKWKKDSNWKEAFMKILHRVHHRNTTTCTADESWTRYIMLNRNGSANLLEASSRNYNPMVVFNEFKLQNNLAHFQTHLRLVVEFADVRIIALGVLHKPRSAFSTNPNARALLHPPGVERTGELADEGVEDWHSTHSRNSSEGATDGLIPAESPYARANLNQIYSRLLRPLPSIVHVNYPFFTPSGEDKRWFGIGDSEEGGRQWIGGLMLTAQLIGPHTKEQYTDGPRLQDLDLVVGSGRSQYASLTWDDLNTLAPWLELTKQIDGPGLGL